MMIFTSINSFLYFLPLVAAISLVYAASRHESWRLIWTHALRLGLMILGLMAASQGLLLLINTRV